MRNPHLPAPSASTGRAPALSSFTIKRQSASLASRDGVLSEHASDMHLVYHRSVQGLFVRSRCSAHSVPSAYALPLRRTMIRCGWSPKEIGISHPSVTEKRGEKLGSYLGRLLTDTCPCSHRPTKRGAGLFVRAARLARQACLLPALQLCPVDPMRRLARAPAQGAHLLRQLQSFPRSPGPSCLLAGVRRRSVVVIVRRGWWREPDHHPFHEQPHTEVAPCSQR